MFKYFMRLYIFVGLLVAIGMTMIACGSVLPQSDNSTWSRWDFTNAPRTIINSSAPLTIAWQFTATNSIYWAPVVEQDIVLVRSEYGVQAVDQVTGQEKWKYPLGRSSGEDFPLVTDGHFVAIAGRNHISVVDFELGREMWVCEVIGSESAVMGNVVSSGQVDSLAIDGERIYAVGTIKGGTSQAVAYGIHDGVLQWRQDQLIPRSMFGAYLAGDDLHVFSGGRFVLDKHTGAIIKQRENIDFNSRLSPTVSDQTIFIASLDGTLRALDLISLRPRWALDVTCSRTEHSDFQIPTIVGDIVYAGSGCSEVYAVNLLTGNILWTYRPTEKVRVSSSVAVLDGIGYVIYSDGSLRAIDLDSGKEVGLLQTEPAEVPGVVHGAGITAANGYVYAYFGGRGLFAFKAVK